MLVVGIELGGYRSEADIDFRCLRRLINQLYHKPKRRAASTRSPTPTPIPVFAPVDNPPPPPSDELEGADPEVF